MPDDTANSTDLMPVTWSPGERMADLLASPMTTDQDFRDFALALMADVGMGRLPLAKVKSITEILAMVKDTLTGPQQAAPAIILQQLFASEGADASEGSAPSPHLVIDAPGGVDLEAMHQRQIERAEVAKDLRVQMETIVGDDDEEDTALIPIPLFQRG
jgi:hypothetical protein